MRTVSVSFPVPEWRDLRRMLRRAGLWTLYEGKGDYRFRWGEFSTRLGLTLQYGIYHDDAHLHICILWPGLYFKLPVLIKFRPDTEDWNAHYGVTYHSRAFQFNWRTSCAIIHLPWDWQHVRHTFLWPDGTVHHHAPKRGYQESPVETRQLWPYMYRLKNGTVQMADATINGEEREWRWRWFTWLPWPRRISRDIKVDFSEQIWKGGTLGCGYGWKHGEPMLTALRRMERERRFDR